MFGYKSTQMNQILKQIGIKFGVFTALFLIIAYLVIYFVDYRWMNSIIGGFGLLFIVIVFGFLASYIGKQKLGGYITFKEAFIPYFLTITISIFAGTLLVYLLYGIVDTDTAALLKQDAIEMTQKQMQNFGVPAEQAAISVKEVSSSNPYSLGTLFMSAATRVLLLCIPGMLAALTFRNKSEFTSSQP